MSTQRDNCVDELVSAQTAAGPTRHPVHEGGGDERRTADEIARVSENGTRAFDHGCGMVVIVDDFDSHVAMNTLIRQSDDDDDGERASVGASFSFHTVTRRSTPR